MSKAKAVPAKGPRVFVPLTKIDEEQQLVYGVITEEVKDQAGETMHYAKSKANFEEWSNNISAASGGLSKGNVRIMHQLKVGGKLTDITFDDDAKQIEVCAKVTDATEWNNVLEGCYTGFSVGGAYGKKWTEDGHKYYEAKPNEVSLVDNPCVKGATFTMVKAAGVEEEMVWDDGEDGKLSFHKAAGEEEPAAPVDDTDKPQIVKQIEKAAAAVEAPTFTNDQLAAQCKELQKAANDGRDWMSFMDEARAILTKGDKKDDAEKAKEEDDKGEDDKDAEDDKEKAGKDKPAFGKVTPTGVKQVWTASDGQSFEKKAEAEAHEAELVKAAEEAEDSGTKLTKSIGRIKDLLAKSETGAVVIEDEPEAPSILSLDRVEDLHKAFLELELPREEDGSPKLEKGMYTVSRFASMLGDVAGLARTIKAEGKLEGDDKTDSDVAGALTKQLGTFGDSFMDYAKQQIGELVAGLDTDLSPRACYDYYYRAVEADPENALAKNVCELIEAVEEDTQETLKKFADMATVASVDTEETLQKLAKVEEENETLKKVVDEVLPTVEALEKRLKIMEEKPEPRAPRGTVLNKASDGNIYADPTVSEEDKMAALGELLKSKTPDEIAVMMIKAAQNNPQTLNFASR